MLHFQTLDLKILTKHDKITMLNDLINSYNYAFCLLSSSRKGMFRCVETWKGGENFSKNKL